MLTRLRPVGAYVGSVCVVLLDIASLIE